MNSLKRDSSDNLQLAVVCDKLENLGRLLIASNRGPVQYCLSEDGRLLPTKGSGGIAVALSSLSRYTDFTWVACAMSEGERYAAEATKYRPLVTTLDGKRFSLRFVVIPESRYDKYYNIFCNPFLWFFQHNMSNGCCGAGISRQVFDAWENGYVPANRAFAQVVASEVNGEASPFIMLHDYHLYLVASYIRSQLPNAVIEHFTHIPWPAPQHWMFLPESWCRRICESLCSCDIVGLQTMPDVRNFLLTCELYVPNVRVNHHKCTLQLNGHEAKVNAYPISVDVAELQRLVNSEVVKEYRRKLLPFLGEKTIVRVDRLEPTKNILRGFEAYDTVLARYPNFQGKVSFLSFLVPSRTNLKEYQDYASQVFQMVREINSKYGSSSWVPIRVFYENNYPQAIAGMCLYDVMLVNPLIDGMNLVAKEGPSVNARNGVLVLSEMAGAHEQLKNDAISIAPRDLEGTVHALYDALTMPAEEKRDRAERLRNKIENEDITRWFLRQLDDLQTAATESLVSAGCLSE